VDKEDAAASCKLVTPTGERKNGYRKEVATSNVGLRVVKDGYT
jgi:hypothetical protein